MTGAARNRGGAPVGLVLELPELERAAVVYLRLWCESAETQGAVWNDFAACFGGVVGARKLRSFETLIDIAVRRGRRPLMRHQIGCRCLGADESAFANLVGAAARAETEDAVLLAAHIVRPDAAPLAASLAAEFGLALRRMMTAGPTARSTFAAVETAPGDPPPDARLH